MVCRQFADRIWSSKNLCSGGTALPVILSSNDRCVFGFFFEFALCIFSCIGVSSENFSPYDFFTSPSHYRWVVSFFQTCVPQRIDNPESGFAEIGRLPTFPVGRHFDLLVNDGNLLIGILSTANDQVRDQAGDPVKDPVRDPVKISCWNRRF